MEETKKHLVAVYGSLRKGLGNHHVIKDGELLGEFKTKPEYSLYSLGGFPGLKQEGETSVVMEVYKVDDSTLKRVNRLEGYDPNSEDNSFYDRVSIDTPYGEAYTFIFVPSIEGRPFVKSGDWTSYVKEKLKSYTY